MHLQFGTLLFSTAACHTASGKFRRGQNCKRPFGCFICTLLSAASHQSLVIRVLRHVRMGRTTAGDPAARVVSLGAHTCAGAGAQVETNADITSIDLRGVTFMNESSGES